MFGETYDEAKFNRAIKAASLEDDIKVLPGGIETEIGMKYGGELYAILHSTSNLY